MKTLYLECNMGVAGDMLMSALYELCEDKKSFEERFNSIGLEKVTARFEKSIKCGISGTHICITVNGEEEESVDVPHNHHEHSHHHEHHHHHEHSHHHEHNHSHHHATLHNIEHLISHLAVSEKVKSDAFAVYNLIAQAESVAHAKPVTEIHFHEVGTLDAVADIVGVCMLMEELSVDRIICSPIHVGSGNVKCAHGILPVPAPATAYILRDVPTYSNGILGELCTPTGASLVKYFANEFSSMPQMRVSKIGYGMGSKDFENANCVRAMIGETKNEKDVICEFACNIDDMTAEEIGFAQEILFSNGALDVFTTPISMKKNRPAVLLTCICKVCDKEKILSAIFANTTTIGIREYVCNRYVLDRTMKTKSTQYGDVTVKCVSGYGVQREKIEFDDLSEIAKRENMSILDVKKNIKGE